MSIDNKTIEDILKTGYNRETWKGFLRNLFPLSIFWSNPHSLNDLTSPYVSAAFRLGDVKLDEGGIERSVGLFEVVLDAKVILERNRVGLRNLLKKYWKDMDGAFIVYTQPSSGLWRFTYVSELTGFDSSGEYQEIKTDPKRYTYVFGDGESCRTAVERFQTLLAKGKKATISDIIEAFSVEKLSKSFFDNYKKQYELFCEYLISKPGIYKTNFNGDEKAVRDFVKLFLGRITFLYFIQKKGWLGVPLSGNWGKGDKQFLWSVFKKYKHKSLFYQDVLTKLFFDTLNTPRQNDLIELPDGEKVKVPFLNGGLFEEENPSYRNLVFKEELFQELFNFFNQYNFTIYEDDPNDHTVAVDPEMLGHIFENLLEDNKDKGAFYTPKEIVHYMSQESLIEYLTVWFENKGYEVIGHTSIKDTDETLFTNPNDYNFGQLEIEIPLYNEGKKIDRRVIEKLLNKSLDDSDNSLIAQYIDEFNKALDSVKICDPAIGSGAFPMGLLQEIFAAKQTLWHFKYGNLDGFPASEVKLNIIQNSIYGVDIEKGAVDIARLRFWLSLVVDENEPKPLPNLDYKIVVGNSLVSKLDDVVIEIDWDIDETKHGLFGADLEREKGNLLRKISEAQKRFFYSDSSKKVIALEIRNLKIDLLITQIKLMINSQGGDEPPSNDKTKKGQKNQKYLNTIIWKQCIRKLNDLKVNSYESLRFFEWKLDFPEVLNSLVNPIPGFDIIIGNPPYIKEYTNKEAFDGFRDSPFYMGKMDIWYGFACKMLDLQKRKGIQCFIAQNNWITSYGATLLRKKINNESVMLLFTDFGNYKVFESAGIQTMIYLLKKLNPPLHYKIKYSILTNEKIDKRDLHQFLDFTTTDLNSSKFLSAYSPSEVTDSPFTFNNSRTEEILNNLMDVSSLYLSEDEVANGIHPHYDFVSKKIAMQSGGVFSKGEGIFCLSNVELNKLNLTDDEMKLIKPFFTSEELGRYYASPSNKIWIIYTGSAFKNPVSMKHYPNLKRHLDRFNAVITSDNKPYGLHRARDENFFKGESIVALRKCAGRPSFTYTNFNCYVSATFYVIKTYRLDMVYLTGLLNSRLIAFWLRNKGKMQGNNYQIDKEPLMAIPIKKASPDITSLIINYVKSIIDQKSKGADTVNLENKIDHLVYKLYDLKYADVLFIDPQTRLSETEYEAIKIE